MKHTSSGGLEYSFIEGVWPLAVKLTEIFQDTGEAYTVKWRFLTLICSHYLKKCKGRKGRKHTKIWCLCLISENFTFNHFLLGFSAYLGCLI